MVKGSNVARVCTRNKRAVCEKKGSLEASKEGRRRGFAGAKSARVLFSSAREFFSLWSCRF